MSTPYSIEDIVDVRITLGDRPITQAGFETPLILADTTAIADRVKAYTDPADMITDGFLAGDAAYKLAVLIMSGDNPPREFKVGTYDSGAPETVTEALAAIEDEDTDWFFLVASSHAEADVLTLAAYAEANKKLYITSSQDTDVWQLATELDILGQLKALQYDNTCVIPTVDADTTYPEGAIIGAMAALVPGSSTLNAKTLPGVSTQTFTRTYANNITNKNGNVYSSIGGVGYLREGKMVSGRFFDVVRGSLYLEARMEEDIFALIKRQSDLGRKIPYTETGLLMVETTMATRLNRSVQEGFIAADPAFQIFTPRIEDIPVNDRANRLLPDIPFEARLAGAIQTIIIRGYVSV